MSNSNNMTEKETRERWDESLKRAAVRARELGTLTGRHEWNNISAQLEQMRKNGNQVIVSRSLSKAQIEAGIAERERQLKEKLN